jgi:glutaredoxin 3
MGRITVFSIDGCSHCRLLKAALAARNIPYSDINISHYPQKRADMLALTDRHTVPQVFFNERYIGGADETIQLLNEWDEELKGGSVTARDRYVDTIESEPGPFDVKLSLPTGPPAIQYMNLTVNRPKEITEVNGKHFTTLQLTKELMTKMPRGDLSTFGTVYYNSFKGSEAVS